MYSFSPDIVHLGTWDFKTMQYAMRPNGSYVCNSNDRGYLLLTWLPLIPEWITNHMSSKVWDEIIYTFPNLDGCTVDVWELINNFIRHISMGALVRSMLIRGAPLYQLVWANITITAEFWPGHRDSIVSVSNKLECIQLYWIIAFSNEKFMIPDG